MGLVLFNPNPQRQSPREQLFVFALPELHQSQDLPAVFYTVCYKQTTVQRFLCFLPPDMKLF